MKQVLFQNFKITSNYLEKNNTRKKIFQIFFHKEQFKYLKTTHSYHLVDQSPWRADDKCAETFFLTQKIYRAIIIVL